MFVFVLLISCLPVLFLLPYKFQLHSLCGVEYVICHATVLHHAISPSRRAHAEPLIPRYTMYM